MKHILWLLGMAAFVGCSQATPIHRDADTSEDTDPDAEICVPTTEICDSLDNDCDGFIDEEGGAPLFRHCSNPCGSGIEECDAGLWGPCSAPIPTEEVCDGIDNDCDGEIDEEYDGDPLSRHCSNLCGSGIEECDAGLWGPCSAPSPTEEICDGIDNDCDGEVDEVCHEPDSVRCWTVSELDDQLAIIEVDMSTGESSELARFGERIRSGIATSGLAYLDEKLIFGTVAMWELFEVDLATGEISHESSSYDSGFTATEEELVTFCPYDEGLCFYEDFEALVDELPDRRVPGSFHASRLAVSGDEVYTAWHSTDTIDVHDIHTGRLTRSIMLEDYDDWVWGMSVAAGRLHLLDGGSGARMRYRIAVFDTATGEQIDEVIVSLDAEWYLLSGLWCQSPGPSLP